MFNQAPESRRERYVCQCDLLKRGWTQKAIDMFLVEPDRIQPNPQYQSAAPMKLFLERRVEMVEQSQSFQEYMAYIAKRRAAAQKRAAKQP